MQGAAVGVEQAPEEAAAEQQGRACREREARERAARIGKTTLRIEDRDAPGAHADGLAAAGPGNDEIERGQGQQDALQDEVVERRLVGDIGTASGPIVVSAITGIATLGIASIATGGIGVAGALIFAFLVPEPLYYRATKRDPARPAGP